jgi:hypothetical protein
LNDYVKNFAFGRFATNLQLHRPSLAHDKKISLASSLL